MEHGGGLPMPRSADEWISRADELRATDEISVKPDGKYFAVEGVKAVQSLACA
jgi:hypothetical protein